MRIVLTMVAAVLIAGMGYFFGHRSGLAEATRHTDGLRHEIADLRSAMVETSRQVMLMSMAAAQASHGPAGGRATEATVSTASAAPVADPAPSAGPPKVTETDRKLAQEAAVLIDQAMTRGAWTRFDEERFRQMRAEPSNVDWLPIMRRLSTALNDGRLKPPPVAHEE